MTYRTLILAAVRARFREVLVGFYPSRGVEDRGSAISVLSALMTKFRDLIDHRTACPLTLIYQYISISIWEITRIVLVPRAGPGICETGRWPSAPTCRQSSSGRRCTRQCLEG